LLDECEFGLLTARDLSTSVHIFKSTWRTTLLPRLGRKLLRYAQKKKVITQGFCQCFRIPTKRNNMAESLKAIFRNSPRFTWAASPPRKRSKKSLTSPVEEDRCQQKSSMEISVRGNAVVSAESSLSTTSGTSLEKYALIASQSATERIANLAKSSDPSGAKFLFDMPVVYTGEVGVEDKPCVPIVSGNSRLRIRHGNTTSSLRVESTILAPDMEELLYSISMVIHSQIKPVPPVDRAGFESKIDQDTMRLRLIDMFDDDICFQIFPNESVGMMGTDDSDPSEKLLLDIFHFLCGFARLSEWSSNECSIISLIFINRLLAAKRVPLTLHLRNWRHVLVSALLLAHKVVDDVHLSNASFVDIWRCLVNQPME
jgi:hypothetical protein